MRCDVGRAPRARHRRSFRGASHAYTSANAMARLVTPNPMISHRRNMAAPVRSHHPFSMPELHHEATSQRGRLDYNKGAKNDPHRPSEARMKQTASFGYWLRRRRKALDLTQDALAHQAGCALGTLKKIE